MRALVWLLLATCTRANHLDSLKRFVKRNALKRQCPPKPGQIPLAAPSLAFSLTTSAPIASADSSTPSPVAMPPSNNGTTALAPFAGRGKRGLGFTKPGDTQLFVSAANWGYNWNSGLPRGAQPSIVFLPMLWGLDKSGSWLIDARAAIDAGAPALLGFNEPDCKYGPCQQANLSPQEAADGWRQWMEPFKGKALLISPAVTNGYQTPDKPMGLLWMQQFIDACAGCQIDGFALHIYDRAGVPSYYKDYFTKAYAQLKKPLWLTEVGWSSGSDDERVAFVKDFIPWAEQQDYIAAVAIFGADKGELTMIEADASKLSLLGEAYEAA